MADQEDIRQRAAHHIARARILIDALQDAEQARGSKAATTLGVISAELQQATAVLDGTAQPRSVKFCAPLISGDEFTNEGAN